MKENSYLNININYAMQWEDVWLYDVWLYDVWCL